MRGNVAPRKSKIKFAYFCDWRMAFSVEFKEKSDFFLKNLDFHNFSTILPLL